jgi:histidinol-phosphate/aromatic aminotransferase/cobyric acid decarboxylase-like protein
VNVLTQAGINYAIDLGEIAIAKRHSVVAEQRRRVLDELHDLPVDAPESQANFVWMRASGLSGTELAARLEENHVIVAPGGPLGADDHVRASIFNAPHTGRLLSALREAVEA